MLYTIDVAGPTAKFLINNVAYDPTQSLVLNLGEAEQWELTVQNTPAVVHPFHIHVNPFEIFSISQPNPQGGGVEEKITEPIWRDTVAVEPGWTVKFRTRYEKYTGKFVQHCHILDHEDQGMMMNVEIVDPKARAEIGGPRNAPVSSASSPGSDAEANPFPQCSKATRENHS